MPLLGTIFSLGSMNERRMQRLLLHYVLLLTVLIRRSETHRGTSLHFSFGYYSQSLPIKGLLSPDLGCYSPVLNSIWPVLPCWTPSPIFCTIRHSTFYLTPLPRFWHPLYFVLCQDHTFTQASTPPKPLSAYFGNIFGNSTMVRLLPFDLTLGSPQEQLLRRPAELCNGTGVTVEYPAFWNTIAPLCSFWKFFRKPLLEILRETPSGNSSGNLFWKFFSGAPFETSENFFRKPLLKLLVKTPSELLLNFL